MVSCVAKVTGCLESKQAQEPSSANKHRRGLGSTDLLGKFLWFSIQFKYGARAGCDEGGGHNRQLVPLLCVSTPQNLEGANLQDASPTGYNLMLQTERRHKGRSEQERHGTWLPLHPTVASHLLRLSLSQFIQGFAHGQAAAYFSSSIPTKYSFLCFKVDTCLDCPRLPSARQELYEVVVPKMSELVNRVLSRARVAYITVDEEEIVYTSGRRVKTTTMTITTVTTTTTLTTYSPLPLADHQQRRRTRISAAIRAMRSSSRSPSTSD